MRLSTHIPPPPAKVARDYAVLIRRLEALPRDAWQVQLAGLVSGNPFYAVRREVAADAPTILLTAGMHGDEPAGVEAALQWMEGDDWRAWPVNWLVLPCLNPFGWTHDQRTNADGEDINRHFRPTEPCPEAELLKRAAGQRRFLLAMDLHEDSESQGYYLCESKIGAPLAGERIIQRMGGLIPINEGARLDGRHAQGPGWVVRLARRNAFDRRRHWPLAFHLAGCCTDHFLCSETPPHLPLSQRVRAHLAALQAALRFAIEPLPPAKKSVTELLNSL